MPSPEEVETVTFRLPSALKRLVNEFAELQGTTVTSLVRDALEQYIVPPQRRVYELPGFSPKLDAIVGDKSPGMKRLMVLVTTERDSRKLFFDGVLNLNLCNDTLIAIRRRGGKPWIIPRKDIVAWFDGAAADRNGLGMALQQLGWTAMDKDVF